MSAITGVYGREILDSRGNPTVEVEVQLESGAWGRAAVPSGASTGKREAVELRDGDGQRYRGKGVRQRGAQRRGDDRARDRRHGGQRAGGDRPGAARARRHAEQVARSAPTPSSPSRWRWRARRPTTPGCRSTPTWAGSGARLLPVPMMNVINGGAHADNGIDFQEFMLVPAGADSSPSALRMGVEVFHALKEILKTKKLTTGVGDEGGFAPALASTPRRWIRCMEAIETAGYRPGDDVALALDIAASEFAEDNGRYRLRAGERGPQADEMVDLYEALRRTLSDRLDRGRPRRGRLGGLGAADPAPRRPRAAGGRRPLRHQPGDPPARASRSASPTRCCQGQPDRHADRDAARPSSSPSARATAPSSRTARARPRTPSSPTSRSATNAGQIKTGSLAAQRPHREVQPAPAHRGRAGPRRFWPGRTAFYTRAAADHAPGRARRHRARGLPDGLASPPTPATDPPRATQMRHEISTMERDVTRCARRPAELTRAVDRLRNDPAYVEKLAREEFGMVRPDETVLKFPSTAR